MPRPGMGMGGGDMMGMPGAPAGGAAQLTETDINQLVAQREQARQARNWPLGDSLRDQLRAAGVEIYDKEKFWKSWDGKVGIIGGFGPYGALKDAEIHSILKRRDEAKQIKDWVTADKIREDLRSRGVEVRTSPSRRPKPRPLL